MQLNIGIYGRPFVGKTTLASTFPKVYIMSADGNFPNKNRENIVKEVLLTNADELIAKIDELAQELKKEPKKYETLVLDGITIMSNWWKVIVSRKYNKTFDGLGQTGWVKLKEEFFFNFIYQKIQLVLGRKYGLNTIITFHERYEKDEEGKILFTSPNASDGNETIVTAGMDFHGRMYNKKDAFGKSIKSLQIVDDFKVSAGNRFFIDEDIDNPTYNKILETIKKYTNKDGK